MISLTSEQRASVESRENLLLTACPGSGKTRVILAKLLSLSDDVASTPQFIGCITYTNAAVDEIESRLRTYGSGTSAEKCEVATIHSFCLEFILRPYSWLMAEVPTPFKVISRELSDFESVVDSVEDELGRRPNSRTYDDYESLRIDVDGDPCGPGFVSGVVTAESARRYWEVVRHRGYLDFSMILYYSYRIVSEYPFVSEGIAARFKWLLIDEFQDTTDVQLAIFECLHTSLHTNFFMVGDQNQSIMSFAGAEVDLSDAFAHKIGADRTFSLSGNFRSGPQIVAAADTLIPTSRGMQSAGKARLIAAHVEYVRAARPIDAITDSFLPMMQKMGIELGKAAILAPWWTHLIPVARALREFDVPVFGPGARPYRRRRLIVGLAEQLGACAESDHYLGIPGVERALFRLISDITGSTRFDVFSYQGRRAALGLIYLARNAARTHIGGADWLLAISQRVGEFLAREGWLPESAKASLIASAQDMINDMIASNVDLQNLLISDMGLFANPDKALKLITLHNAKGREFDAVAMVCMNNGHIPHFAARTRAEYEEARRLFYVGMTRPKKLLVVASDQSDRRNQPCPFIAEARLS